jgi:hypothetical protein
MDVEPSSSSSSPCDCVCCREGALHRSYCDGTVTDPLLLLQCRRFRQVGPSNPSDEEERTWWQTHEPFVFDWLREEAERGVEDLVQARYGATTLLSVPDMRAIGIGDDRPAYCWDEIDAHEILFETFAHGGIPEAWDARTIVEAIRSFAAYLVRRGAIDPEPGAALERDLDLWIPRVLAFYEGGPWWTPTGPVT